VRATNHPNERAQSPTRPFVGGDAIGLDHAEVKFQLSLKTKLLENVLGSRGDVWFGYTQQSYWQAGNQRYSSLFRESNYEPELIFVHPVNFSVGGLNVRYVGASLNHQSNGQSGAYSRSWNRVIGDVALQYGDWTVHVRPWARVFASRGDRNDNPDILNYAGRGELTIERRIGGHVLSTALRHTLRGGSRSRGSAQADWAFPLLGGIKGHLQLFTGYNESLIDYNHSQTSVSVGVSFFD
jgi:phospholipase A1